MTPAGLGTPRRTDVVVVGGGVMGSAAAWALARRGVGVVLLERFGPGHTRGAPHGRARIHRGTDTEPHHQALVAEGRRLWAELEAETGTTLLHPAPGVASADAAVAALQAAAAQHGAVVRHHRRVDAVQPAPDGGVLVRQAGGATVRARAAVVSVGGWTADVLGDGVRDRLCPVVVAAGFGGHGLTSAPAIGRVLADLALGAPADAEPCPRDAHAVLR